MTKSLLSASRIQKFLYIVLKEQDLIAPENNNGEAPMT